MNHQKHKKNTAYTNDFNPVNTDVSPEAYFEKPSTPKKEMSPETRGTIFGAFIGAAATIIAGCIPVGYEFFKDLIPI